jgi:hypothetical protein
MRHKAAWSELPSSQPEPLSRTTSRTLEPDGPAEQCSIMQQEVGQFKSAKQIACEKQACTRWSLTELQHESEVNSTQQRSTTAVGSGVRPHHLAHAGARRACGTMQHNAARSGAPSRQQSHIACGKPRARCSQTDLQNGSHRLR